MAQPKPVVAPAESRASVSELERARDAVNAAAVALTAKVNASKVKPGEMVALTTKFFDSLVALNDKLKPYNNGKDAIPVTGSTPDERQRSFNTWLGLAADSPITADTMKAFDRKMVEVFAIPTSDSANATLAVLREAEAAKAAAASASPVPKPVAAAPVSGVLSESIDPLMLDIQYIIDNAVQDKKDTKGQATKRKAQAYKDYFDKYNKAKPAEQERRKKEAEAKVAEATTFLYGDETKVPKVPGNLAPVEAAALDKAFLEAHKDVKKIDDPKVAVSPLYQRAKALGEKADVPHAAKQLIPDLWLLGEPQVSAALTLMEQGKYTEAQALFDSEQKLYKRLISDFVVPIGEAAITYAGKAPSRNDLAAAERRLKLKPGTLNIRTSGTIHNGREDIEKAMRTRVDTANTMLKAAKVSFQEVSGLYDAVTLDERVTHSLIDMWELAKSSKLDTLDKNRQTSIYISYAKAAKTIVDPNYNPYKDMEREQRQAIVMLYLGVTDPSIFTSKDPKQKAVVAKAERDIITVLSRSMPERYNDALYALYQAVLAIPDISTNKTLAAIAEVRSVKPVAERDYSKYISGTTLDVTTMTAGNLSTKELQSTARLTLARAILQNAVDAAVERKAVAATATTPEITPKSGLPETDEMIMAARAWLKATEDVSKYPAEKIPGVSDTLYGMAFSLASIREAELWASDEGSVLRPSSVTPAQITAARSDIKFARRVFKINFSGANDKLELQVLPGYNFTEANILGSAVVNSLAPRALSITDTNDRFGVLNGNTAPHTFGIEVADMQHPTAEEQRKGAIAAESMHLSFLAMIKDNAAFGYSTTDSTLKAQGLYGPFSALDPRASRVNPRTSINGFPILDSVLVRARVTGGPTDVHYVPTAATKSPAMGNAHEEMGLSKWGGLYMEGARMVTLHADPSAPQLLRGLDVAPNAITDPTLKAKITDIATRLGLPLDKPFLTSWDEKMLDAATKYASAEGAEGAAKQQAYVNDLFLGLVDARIAELKGKASGMIQIKGKKVPITELVQYKDPRAANARNALEALAMLEGASGVRSALVAGKSTDLLGKTVTPKDAIRIAEMGMVWMDPDNFKDITPENVKPPIANEPVAYVATVEKEQKWVDGDRWGKFKANITAYVGKDPDYLKRKQMTLDAYGTARGSPVLMEYTWIPYEEFSGKVIMLPNIKRTDPNWDGSGGAFTGRYMENIRLPDGRTGNAFVRVEKRSERSGSDYSNAMDYEAVKVNGQYDVLFETKAGASSPYEPVYLDDRAKRMCTKFGLDTFTFRTGTEGRAMAIPSPRN